MRTIAMIFLLGCFGATAHASTIQTRTLVSSGGNYATGGIHTLNANLGDIIVGPSSGGPRVWPGFWSLDKLRVGWSAVTRPFHWSSKPIDPSTHHRIGLRLQKPSVSNLARPPYGPELARGHACRVTGSLDLRTGTAIGAGWLYSRASHPRYRVRKIVTWI